MLTEQYAVYGLVTAPGSLPAAAYHAAAAADIETWRTPGALDKTFHFSFARSRASMAARS
jgi:hypothetical protein